MKKLLTVLILLVSSQVQANEVSNIVYNYSDNTLLVQEHMDKKRPIASLTKLMTALLVVESNTNLDEKIKYQGGIFQSKLVSKEELLDSLLIRSDNAAAKAFANNWRGGEKEFIKEMNARAKELGMNYTEFFDPSGLDKRNVSTARDLTKLVIETSKHKIICEKSSSKYITIEHRNKQKISYVSIGNTNKNLLFEFDDIILSKTGWTNPAGRCLALMVQKDSKKYVIIILGERTTKEREEKARQLINNYAILNETEKDHSHLFNF